MKIAYKIKNIEEYGKFISYCIKHDISVWRTYYEKEMCYYIDYEEKRCYYSSEKWYLYEKYHIVTPKFVEDCYGNYDLLN